MKNPGIILSFILILMILVSGVSAQDITIADTAQEDVLITKNTGSEDELTITRPTEVPVDMISLKNSVEQKVENEAIIPGKGTGTVTLWNRSVYENQPKSVVMSNAKEMFPDGLEVPKPLLDRPIVSAWDDLKPGYACEGILNRPYYFQQLQFGEEFTLDITYRNVGTQTWDFNVDVMFYTGDKLEKNGAYIYDIWKDNPDDSSKNNRIVRPGESIRITIPMKAPTEKYHDDNKYYSAYTLVKNWDRYGWDALHSGDYESDGGTGMFCPVYFYIYVP